MAQLEDAKREEARLDESRVCEFRAGAEVKGTFNYFDTAMDRRK